MRRTRTIAVASLTALALLAGCGGDDDDSSSTTTAAQATTTAAAATSTTKSAEALKAALLTPADVPGSTVSADSASSLDFSACFPGNPLGGKDFPGEAEGPDLELTDGDVNRQYSSGARQATREQATDFVTRFGSPPGSRCIVDAFKAFAAAPPNPLDASGLTGKVTNAPVADGGNLLTISGNFVSGTDSIPVQAELLAFRKGGIVVLTSAAALQGPTVPGQSLELAQKIAGRLS